MKFLKIISLILASVMILGILASCSTNPDDEPARLTTSPSDTGSDEGNFVKADYQGEDFTFLYIKHSDVGKDYYGGDYLDADSYTGDTINDAVYARNLKVEEKYNVNIEQRVEISGDPSSLLQTFYMSGDFCFDVIYGWTYKLGSCITENYFANFYDLPTADLTQSYWGGQSVKDLEIDGKLYLCMSDISMNKLQWGGLLFYNKNMMEDYNLESDFGNIYDLVRDGKWTLDTFLKMVTSISTDLDGNGTIGKDDVYGILDGGSDGSGYALTSGITFTTKNDDGSLSLSFYNEKLLDIINKVNPVYSDKKYVKNYNDIWDEGGTDGNGAYADQWEYARSFFATDHALFCSGTAYITSEFRNMTSSYGIIPEPKYDEIQENYITSIDTNASIFALPATTRQDGVSTASMDRTSAILEYMSYQSSNILLPEYYDTLIKGQRLDSDDDSQMLDIVRDSIHLELVSCVGIKDIEVLVTQMFSKPASASSNYKRNQKKLQKTVDDFYTKVIMMDDSNTETSN